MCSFHCANFFLITTFIVNWTITKLYYILLYTWFCSIQYCIGIDILEVLLTIYLGYIGRTVWNVYFVFFTHICTHTCYVSFHYIRFDIVYRSNVFQNWIIVNKCKICRFSHKLNAAMNCPSSFLFEVLLLSCLFPILCMCKLCFLKLIFTFIFWVPNNS